MLHSTSPIVLPLAFSAAYEAYCGEMKAQLEELKLENEALKRRVGTADANALELLSAMTSLCVCSVSSGPHQSYSCTVIEGVLKGDVILKHYCTLHDLPPQ